MCCLFFFFNNIKFVFRFLQRPHSIKYPPGWFRVCSALHCTQWKDLLSKLQVSAFVRVFLNSGLHFSVTSIKLKLRLGVWFEVWRAGRRAVAGTVALCQSSDLSFPCSRLPLKPYFSRAPERLMLQSSELRTLLYCARSPSFS